MLRGATLGEIQNQQISAGDGYLVVTSRFYPRFLARSKVDEYYACLAPSKDLLKEFKRESEKVGHDAAFQAMEYEKKFELTEEGLLELKRLSELSTRCDVFLACYCARDQRCHRDLLLLMAEKLYGAKIEPPGKPYAVFVKRLNNGEIRAI